MSTALQAVAESKPPFRGSNPAVLVTLPAEVRLAIYGFLFRKRVAMMRNGVASNREARRSNLTYRGGKGGKTKLIKIDETQDQMTRTERSSQLLRVCRSIHDEALPVLYDDTLFYLYGGAHIVSLHTLAHNESVRTIVLRLDVEETDDYLDFESQMRPLSSEVITFPNLKSLQIKIKLHTFSYRSDRRKMDASFIRIDTLFSMLRVVTPQNQPRSFFEDETKKGSEIAFRMVIGDAERQERVRACTSIRKIPPSNCL